MFEGFTLEYVDVGRVALRVRHGGQGPPVVLSHGHPRTHTRWHRVAPLLAGSFIVVRPDLRGYGQSTPPPDAPEYAQSSKRAMADHVVALIGTSATSSSPWLATTVVRLSLSAPRRIISPRSRGWW